MTAANPQPSTLSLHDALPICGPKSAETKEKSSRNSLRHGFTSRHTILLECEDEDEFEELEEEFAFEDRKSTRLNSSHQIISYAVFCLKKKKKKQTIINC